jgi:hypothetical protein
MAGWLAAGEVRELPNDRRIHADRPGVRCSGQLPWRSGTLELIPEHSNKLVE